MAIETQVWSNRENIYIGYFSSRYGRGVFVAEEVSHSSLSL